MMGGRKRYRFIPILVETRDILLNVKHEGESWDHLIRRLLYEAGYRHPSLPLPVEEAMKQLEEEAE